MSFDKLYAWALGVVIAFAAVGQLSTLQTWIWKAQARVLFESRTSTWGSPRIFPVQSEYAHKKQSQRGVR